MREVEDSSWRSAGEKSIIYLPIVCITQESFLHPINTACASYLCTVRAAAECIAVERRQEPGLVSLIRSIFFCLHNVSAGLIIPRFCILSRKITNRIPRREGIKMHKADWVLSGFCLRMRYQNRAQAHSLAWEALQLSGFSTSLVDIPSKVAEVLALAENVPRGQIRQTEPKPKATNAPVGFRPVRFSYS